MPTSTDVGSRVLADEPTTRYCGSSACLMIKHEIPTVAGAAMTQEERRTITVLFVDMVGFTALVDQLDPEDVRALQRDYFRAVAQVVSRWNGVVEKYIGDAVMAVFGARYSDEYDAYRAVRAGLHIQDELNRRHLAGDVRVRVRVGIATGEAVVDLAQIRHGGQAMVSGSVVSTAARLQEYAPNGSMIVCAATRQATESLLSYQNLPPISVAGKARPIDVSRPAAPPRCGTAVAEDNQTPLVGRGTELATVVDCLTCALRDRTPRWISVIGYPGAGKSRLLAEAARTVQPAAGPPVLWQIGNCPPFPVDNLEPLAEMVRAHAGIVDGDLPATVRRRLAAVLDDLLDAAELPGAIDTLVALLNPPAASSPAMVEKDAARVWQRLLLATAARQPLVVALDDLHRATPAMTRFLRQLFDAAVTESLPLAVVETHRPERAESIPTPSSALRCTVLLRPLGRTDAAHLLRQLLDRAGHPPGLVRRLLPVTGGNPLYAREYVHALARRTSTIAGTAAEGGDLPTPEAVRRIVSARLDRLDGFDRAAVQAAAVLGEVIRAEAIAYLLQVDCGRARAALRRLEAPGLLVRRACSVDDQPSYAFPDRATRQVARARLPRTVRADYQLRATEWLEMIPATGHRVLTEDWAAATPRSDSHRYALANQSPSTVLDLVTTADPDLH